MQSLDQVLGRPGDHEALLTTGLDGRILSFGPGAEALLGRSRKEVEGQSIDILMPTNHVRLDALNLQEVAAGNTVRNVMVKVYQRDGRELRCLQTMVPVRDGAGHVVLAARCMMDLTFVRDAELAMRVAIAQVNGLQTVTSSKVPPALHQCAVERDRLMNEYLRVVRAEVSRLRGILGEAQELIEARQPSLEQAAEAESPS